MTQEVYLKKVNTNVNLVAPMMQPFLPTFVFRHKKENLQKCSLRGLEKREDFRFFSYPLHEPPPDFSHYLVLAVEAPPLSKDDAEHGLVILDATWRYAAKMEQTLGPLLSSLPRRSLPSHFRTAYPRRQQDCPNPETGLASLEAIYLAYSILGRNTDGLLDGYYWKNAFLEKNGLG